jgi:hypothetical protein
VQVVPNVSRPPSASLARHFGCHTVWQSGQEGTERYIGERPQSDLGLECLPPRGRPDLVAGPLNQAGVMTNESRPMGAAAHAVVAEV